ncbi:phospholipid phosphatase homolog 1.2 homolog isoform X2 [Topomyia yanbarensis]|uniref:phospholipid phosphatase homolog 1.2 homolog isoform X2 n=1 Tax=Topomyia yanbarensis TaxID=2498891 RepID=UPI00273BAA72|nr:phospholipid phosphatase homolog 1.2 homolog isoform X2 [Topomyia yanbarensis]
MPDIESLGRFGRFKPKCSVPLVFDVISASLVIIFITISELGLLPQVVKRGYYCDDRSIQRPFTGDTVSACVISLSGFVPLFLIWLTEAIFYSPTITEYTETDVSSSRCSQSFHEAWHWGRKYGRGLFIKLLIVDALKIFSGEHRPHFLDTCRPDVHCEGNEFISTYMCTNPEETQYFIRDASKSFPSGHASISVYEVIFMVWYLLRRVPKVRSHMALPLCYTALGLWGIFCPLSRIMDNRHHWWDVLAGSIIGVIAAGFTCIFDCQNFDRTKQGSSVTTYKEHDIKLIPSITHYQEGNNLNNIVNSS